MELGFEWVKGLTFGIEYDEFDEEEQGLMGIDFGICISLGFFRFLLARHVTQ